MDYAAFCSDCKQYTEVAFDHAAGDMVCTECGVVLEARTIDERPEYRTIWDDYELNKNDRVRVGGPANSLLPDAVLSTTISKPQGASNGEFKNISQKRLPNNSDWKLIQAFMTISDMCDRLGLLATIKDRANEICKKVEDLKPSKGRNQNTLLAACLYIACRLEGNARTVKEICSVANGASMKEINRAREFIVNQLELAVEMGNAQDNTFMRRFCSSLGMTNQAIKAAEEAVKRAEEFDIRRSPISIAAAVIYIITELSDDKKLLRDISLATGISDQTIRHAVNDLYPHLSKIVPIWYAKEEDLRKLRSLEKIRHNDKMG